MINLEDHKVIINGVEMVPLAIAQEAVSQTYDWDKFNDAISNVEKSLQTYKSAFGELEDND
jgi:hypothetical protein